MEQRMQQVTYLNEKNIEYFSYMTLILYHCRPHLARKYCVTSVSSGSDADVNLVMTVAPYQDAKDTAEEGDFIISKQWMEDNFSSIINTIIQKARDEHAIPQAQETNILP